MTQQTEHPEHDSQNGQADDTGQLDGQLDTDAIDREIHAALVDVGQHATTVATDYAARFGRAYALLATMNPRTQTSLWQREWNRFMKDEHERRNLT